LAQITDIRDRFEAIQTSITDINTFMFDAFSMVNSTRNKTYPLLLLKVPETATNPNISKDWTDYDIEFFLATTNNQSSARAREVVWDELRTLGEQVLVELKSTPSVYRIKDKTVTWDYGYDVAVDKLIVVRCTLTMGAFHCFTAFNPVPTITWGTWTGNWPTKTANWNTYT